MDALEVYASLTRTYLSFAESFSEFRSDAIGEWVTEQAEQGRLLWREPYLTVRRAYESGLPLAEIAGIEPDAVELFGRWLGDNTPYRHQSDAIAKALGGRNVIVATGTGSGKSFSFYVPVVSAALAARVAGEAGIKAVLIYPMNALANAQYEDLVEILDGAGLTIANYTGDLPDTHDRALRDFATLFGRDARGHEVIDRETLRNEGTDLLVTNFVMLELALTRFEDRKLFPFEHMAGLKTLVLDEVHTYSGRQGADVACLIRRFKQHTGTAGLRCIATSATIDSSGGGGAADATARFAQDLFGEPFEPEDVVTEAYATPDLDSDLEPELAWLEDQLFGETLPRDRLAKAFGERFDGQDLREVLASDRAQVALAPRVHAFFSQGRSVTLCGRTAGTPHPHLSETGEARCGDCYGDGIEDVPAFPVVFCAACGQEYLVASRVPAPGGAQLVPREFETLEADDEGAPLYVFPESWDSDVVPPDESHVRKDGLPRKGKEGGVPVNELLCGRCGVLGGACEHTGDHRNVALIPRPFLFCPSCGVVHGAGREFNKFRHIGLVGRATATDVLVSQLLGEVGDPRRVIAFCDNRQDSSFQYAHLNAFHRRQHFRRALYAGLSERSDGAVAAEAARAALDAMKAAGAVPEYAEEAKAKFGKAAQEAEARYVRYLAFGALLEVSGYARLVQPSLEDAGAASVVYDGLGEVAAHDELWAGVADLAALDADGRYDYARGLLDVMRRARAFDAPPFLDGISFRESDIAALRDDALFHESSVPPQVPTVFSDDIPAGTRGVNARRFTYKSGSMVRWTRRVFGCDRHDAARIIEGAVAVLASAEVGLLREVKVAGGRRGITIASAMVYLHRMAAPAGQRCPKCGSRYDFRADTRPCPRCIKVDTAAWSGDGGFFWGEYTAPLAERVAVLAEEHSAQVSGGERKTAERRFEDSKDPLNVLVCTPTMELGIDIGELRAVYLRNVPPSPANYAQRAGRAGRRRGESALVATFCAAGGRRGPHDRYFFDRPEGMISGRIAPPRFLLDNPMLIEAHLHSLVMQHVGDWKLPPRPREVLDVAKDNLPLFADLRADLAARVADRRETIVSSALKAFADETAAFAWLDEAFVQGLVDGFVEAFDDAWGGFRRDYENARADVLALQQRQLHEGLSRDEDRHLNSLLARMNDMRSGEGDYYTYRLLAAEGFLPNYAFPRRAASAFFTDRKERIGRARTLALREFAPDNSIYYRGNRYQIIRAQPRARGGAPAWEKLKLCACGAFLRGEEVDAAGACAECGEPLTDTHAITSALELPDAVARPRARAGADEEERLRRGYEVEPHYRLGPSRRSGRLGSLDLAYGHNGRLLLVNRGFRGADTLGFTQCTKCRLWNPPDDHFGDNKPCGERDDSLQTEIVLFVLGDHDMLEVTLPPGVDEPFALSCAYTLEQGIQIAFQLDGSELRSYVFHRGGRWRVLLYETDEGGLGVLAQLGRGEGWERLINHALHALHVDPTTGEEDPGACVAACYDCLLTYFNQQHHRQLDRRPVADLLLTLRAAAFAPDGGDPSAYEDLLTHVDSTLEREVIERMRKRGLPAPDSHHLTLLIDDAPVANADLYYEYGRIVVFVDGPAHDKDYVSAGDGVKRKQLQQAGYLVLVVHHTDIDAALDKLATRLGV